MSVFVVNRTLFRDEWTWRNVRETNYDTKRQMWKHVMSLTKPLGPAGGVEAELYSFLMSALGGGEWPTSRRDRFIPGKEPRCLWNRKGGWDPEPRAGLYVSKMREVSLSAGIPIPDRPARKLVSALDYFISAAVQEGKGENQIQEFCLASYYSALCFVRISRTFWLSSQNEIQFLWVCAERFVTLTKLYKM